MHYFSACPNVYMQNQEVVTVQCWLGTVKTFRPSNYLRVTCHKLQFNLSFKACFLTVCKINNIHINYFDQNMWHFCRDLSHCWHHASKHNDLSFYAFVALSCFPVRVWHQALVVKCLMNSATLSLPAGVSTADKTILGHSANRGRESQRKRETCRAA